MKILREVIITVAIAVTVFFALRLNVQTYEVYLSSMEPSFVEGECIMVNKVIYRSSDPQRGDVIIFWPPTGSGHPYIKRVIGLPGEIVEVKEGRVFVNGTPLDEDEYIKERPNYTMAPVQIPEGEYFVLGDNRNNSSDSHTGWTVPKKDIVGKAWFVYWPPSRCGVVKHHSYPELEVIEGQGVMLTHVFWSSP